MPAIRELFGLAKANLTCPVALSLHALGVAQDITAVLAARAIFDTSNGPLQLGQFCVGALVVGMPAVFAAAMHIGGLVCGSDHFDDIEEKVEAARLKRICEKRARRLISTEGPH